PCHNTRRPLLRLPDRYDPGADPLVGLRKATGKARGNRRRLGVSLRDADAGFEPDYGMEVPRIALAFSGQPRWNPDVERHSREIAAKFRRRYPDDGDRVPVDLHSAVEDGLVAMKIVLPHPIADDGCERFGPVAVFVASERATQDRLYAQDVEVVSGDPFVPREIRLFSLADRGGALLVQQQSGNTPKAVLEVPGVGVGNLMLHAAGADGLKHGELSVVPGAAERV